MFYITEAVLKTKDMKFSSHKSVISGFGKHFVKEGIFKKEYGRFLKEIFEQRLTSDYSYEFTDEDTAKETLKIAKDFVKTLTEYLKDNKFL